MRWTRWATGLALFAGAVLPFWALGMDAREAEPRLRSVHRLRLVDGARGFLGIGLQPMTPELRLHFGAPDDAGILVSSVEEDSPAASAGIEVGDVVVRVGDDEVATPWDVRHLVSQSAGKTVAIEVRRDGRALALSATLGEREATAGVLPVGDFRSCGLHRLEALGERLDAVDWEELGDCIGARLEAGPWGEISDEVGEALRSALRSAPRIHLRHPMVDDDELEKRLEELEKRLGELADRLEDG